MRSTLTRKISIYVSILITLVILSFVVVYYVVPCMTYFTHMVTYIFLSFSILVESEKSNDKKRLVFGALPKLNLPQRSHEESRHKTCRKRKERTDVINLNNKKKNDESESYFYHPLNMHVCDCQS